MANDRKNYLCALSDFLDAQYIRIYLRIKYAKRLPVQE